MTYISHFKNMLLLVCGVIGLSLMVLPANAATIDLSPLTALAGEFAQVLIELLAAVLVGAVAWAGRKVLGLQIEEKQRDSLHGAIERGIGGAFETLLKKSEGKTSFDIDNEVVALVANYVVKMSPDAVKYFGLTPNKLADLIKAKFGEKLLSELTDVAVSAQADA